MVQPNSKCIYLAYATHIHVLFGCGTVAAYALIILLWCRICIYLAYAQHMRVPIRRLTTAV
jgi:hypothetical protein